MECFLPVSYTHLFIDMNETGEEGVAREVLEETGLKVKKAVYQFTLPNRCV